MSGTDWPRNEGELLAQLTRQRDRYEQLVRNMSDLLLLVEPDGTVSFTNRQNELPPGGGTYPAVGSHAIDFVAEEDRPRVREAMAEVFAGEASRREVVFRLRQETGGQRIIEGTATPVVEDGRVVQLEFLGRDVTERHAAAEALRRANQELARRQEDLQRDLDVAATIHASLLPGVLETDRILVDLKHIPLLGVGGDYVYVHRADPLRPAVAIFDVSGHGIASALVANRVHSAVYAIMAQGAPPAEMVSRLNRFVYGSFSDLGMFVTLFGMQFDLVDGSACYCGAGHPPVLRRRGEGGRVDSLASAHLPIGVAENVFLGEPMRQVDLEPGDTFWLYTDGLIELRRPEGDILGVEGLTERLRRFPPCPPQPGMAECLLGEVLGDFEPPEDDLTVVVAAVK